MKKKLSLINNKKEELFEYLSSYREMNKEIRLFDGDVDEVCYREQLKNFCNVHHYDFVDVNRWGEPIVRVMDI